MTYTLEDVKSLLSRVKTDYGREAAIAYIHEHGVGSIMALNEQQLHAVGEKVLQVCPHYAPDWTGPDPSPALPQAPLAPATTGLKMGDRAPATVTIDIRGPVGVGKTALAGAFHRLFCNYDFEVDSSKVDDVDPEPYIPQQLEAINPKPRIVITETVEREVAAVVSEPRDIYTEAAPHIADTAYTLLQEAAKAVLDRVSERDVEEEPSMGRCVRAFNELTGHQLSERDGWLFMAVLKAARATATPTGRKDDYVDGAAYFGLAGESVLKEKQA